MLRYVILLSSLGLTLAGCDRGQANNANANNASAITTDDSGIVYTATFPLEFVAKRLTAKTGIEVINPNPYDIPPFTWRPSDETVRAMQNAALIVINGADFETWATAAPLPRSRLVNTSKPLENDFIKLDDTVTHSHGPGGEHSHEGIDGYTWVDPHNLKIQAETLKSALARRFPQHEQTLADNLDKLSAELDSIIARLDRISERLGDRPIATSHPVYNYLGKRWGWNMFAVHLEPGAPLIADEVQELQTFADEQSQPLALMLWEDNPAQPAETALRDQFGLTCVVYHTGDTVPDELLPDPDYIAMLDANLERLEAALQ